MRRIAITAFCALVSVCIAFSQETENGEKVNSVSKGIEKSKEIDDQSNSIKSISRVIEEPLPLSSVWLKNGTKIYYNGGYVGIGTSSPVQKLHVNGNIRGNQTGGAIRIQTSYGYTDIGAKNSSWSHFYTDRARFFFNKEIRVDQGLIGSYNEDLKLRTSGTTRITIKNSGGNVGIGTTSPIKKLDVKGDINFTGNLYKNGVLVSTSGSGGSSKWLSNGSKIYYNGGYVGIGLSNPSAPLHIEGKEGIHMQRSDWTPVKVKMLLSKYTGSIGGLRFMMTPDGNWANWKDVLFLSPLGRVGIGTTDPQAELAVKGKVVCQEIQVTLSGWPDYVFEEGYNLLPVNELKDYIITNKHLPNVPSANNVEEKGVNLGEMDKILLQKIEELTLYIIQLENRISELEK